MATERVSPMTPVLEAEYSAVEGQLVLPAMEEMLTMLPEPYSIMAGATALLQRRTPVEEHWRHRTHNVRAISACGCCPFPSIVVYLP